MNTASQFAIEELPEHGICVVRVRGRLDVDRRSDFHFYVDQWLMSEQPKLVLDLTEVTRFFSLFLGTVADACERARQREKSPSVLVTARISDLFQRAGLTEQVPLVVVSTVR